MSIADKIERLSDARNNIISALEDKGIDASEHGFESFANDINDISTSGITPSGSLTITENDTYDVTNYAEVIVEVEGEGGTADPAYTINVSTQQALDLIDNYFQQQELYSMLSPSQIAQWQEDVLPTIFNMN